MIAIQIVNRDDGRLYEKSDTTGGAFTRGAPLGALVIWLPGYWPIKYFDLFRRAHRPS